MPSPILVIRFSALGDVALTVPVFKTLEKSNPDQSFLLLTQKRFTAIFEDCKNVETIGVDLNVYKGITGLSRLVKWLTSHYNFDEVVDLHDVLRSKWIVQHLKMKGKTVHVFTKGRKEKRSLLRSKRTDGDLPHTCDRYLSAFKFLTKELAIMKGPYFEKRFFSGKPIPYFKSGHTIIGIAPFSKHASKEWPIGHVERLISRLVSETEYIVQLWAFGDSEKSKSNTILERHPEVKLIDESYSISDQLYFLQNINAMISMDSGNMHLAALAGTKVISIWGSTHPAIGFYPLHNEEHMILPEMVNPVYRPLSIYGKVGKKNLMKAKEMLKHITPELVFDKLLSVL